MSGATGIVVAGVAGQAVYALARDLADGALTDTSSASVCGNPDARPGRGVEAHARLGADSSAVVPLVKPGECHLVVGLEPLEALRCAVKYFTPGMVVISLTQRVLPSTVLHRGAEYPSLDAAAQQLTAAGAEVTWVEGGPDAEVVAALVAEARAALSAVPA